MSLCDESVTTMSLSDESVTTMCVCDESVATPCESVPSASKESDGKDFWLVTKMQNLLKTRFPNTVWKVSDFDLES